ncbi:MAG: carbon monoxide dehydrogenase subunit G [Rhodospirillales bacterium]|nr:carbon monoxide dehydrogenase subunit G [Rhodospirillales bacterium]
MDMTGERRIAAPRQVVWDALNDPAVLKASIPGCESLEKLSDTQMKATAAVKIGPISARFTGNVQLTDMDPPNGYTIGGEGQGGVAGFAKGGAKVRLADDGGATLLGYEVHAQVGGKIAQLGARLIDATAKQMADAFFTRFTAQVEAAAAPAAPPPGSEPQPIAAGHAPAGTPPIAPPPVAPPPEAISPLALLPAEPFGLPLAFWFGGAVFAVIVLLFLVSSL